MALDCEDKVANADCRNCSAKPGCYLASGKAEPDSDGAQLARTEMDASKSLIKMEALNSPAELDDGERLQ